LEIEKKDINTLIAKTESSAGVVSLPEAKLKEAFDNARRLFMQGTLPQIRQLIALYVQKVIIHKEQVEVIINLLNLYPENESNHTQHKMSVATSGGGEGDNENATLFDRANCFDRHVAIKEVFDINKSILFIGYKYERIFTGGFKL
jgi:hypothetical protein